MTSRWTVVKKLTSAADDFIKQGFKNPKIDYGHPKITIHIPLIHHKKSID